MNSREDLQYVLENILGSDKVYYQSPSQLSYPCILYEKNSYRVDYANDIKYKNKTLYTITLIGKKVSNENIVDKILELPYCSFNRQYKSDNLYHDVFDLYY